MIATGLNNPTLNFLDEAEVHNMKELRSCSNLVTRYPLGVELAIGLKHDNKFTICGGWDGFDAQTDCYSYTYNRWDIESFSMNPPRFAAMSVEIRPGEWLIMGGHNQGTTGGAFTAFSDTKLVANGILIDGPTTLPEPIYGGSAVMLNDTHMFVAGGFTGSVNSVNNYMYNVALDQWTQIASRESATEAFHMSGTFYNSSVGEIQIANIGVDGIQVYSPRDDSWQSGLPFPSPISYLARSAAVQQGRDSFILVGGRTNFEEFIDAIYEFDEDGLNILQENALVYPREVAVALPIYEADYPCN